MPILKMKTLYTKQGKKQQSIYYNRGMQYVIHVQKHYLLFHYEDGPYIMSASDAFI